MTTKTENEVRNHKKHIEEIIETLRERIYKDHTNVDVTVIQTISTLEDEVEVLKWVLNEPSDHIGSSE